jgi:oligopeptide transport system substrate-binding protein
MNSRRGSSRRGLICLLAGLSGLTLMGLATAAAAETVFRIGNMGEPTSLDPHKLAGTWENRIAGDMFLGLTTEAADGETIPGAAESWEISEDGTLYIFQLREHQWADGTPVTAVDFEFALKRILSPDSTARYASLLYPIKNAEAYKTGAVGAEELGVRAVDERTLEIELASPTPYFLDQLTHYTAFPVPKHLVEGQGDEWVRPGTIIGNGPFRVVEWTPNTQIVAEKNPNFYDADSVRIDRVIYYPDEDRNAVLRRFRAGEIDYAADFASEQIDWLKANLPNETRIAPYLGIYYYPINSARAPFDDPRVRQALSMAIDREAITDKVLRTGELPAYSFVPPGTGNYGEPAMVSWKDLPQAEKTAQAKALLEEAGYGPSNPLRLTLAYNTSENHRKIAVAIQAMWRELGVQAELSNSEVKVHYEMLEQNDFDVARAGWIADYNDPQNFLFLLQTSSGRLNYGRYSNPEFDALMDKAARTIDLDERAKVLQRAEAILMEDAATIPIYYYVSKNLVQNYVKGWESNTKDIHRTRYIAIER